MDDSCKPVKRDLFESNQRVIIDIGAVIGLLIGMVAIITLSQVDVVELVAIWLTWEDLVYEDIINVDHPEIDHVLMHVFRNICKVITLIGVAEDNWITNWLEPNINLYLVNLDY